MSLEAAKKARTRVMKWCSPSLREVAKKSLEKAAERVRCLEDDLAKSRAALPDMMTTPTLHLGFPSRLLKTEAKGILERNVEFSQLVVDYQQKWRESSESLIAAEELWRKLTMEVNTLFH
ncbi:hypothetical protein JHK82_018837 [Glycine max]|nr:hypothetical protein JHK82_018837 [Glycine max]